jgi:putative hydrolase of HD superfamily
VGDITPHDNVSKEDKETRERAAFEEIEQLLGRSSVAREMRQLWEEYEAGASAEARLVKDADRMDMIVQAFEYERAQGLSLEDFFASTRGGFTHPAMVALDAELRARRAAMLAERAGEASRASAAK